MDYGYYILIGLAIIGAVFGASRTRRTQEQSSSSGWMGLIILCVLIGGLAVAAYFRNEKWAWFFGLAFMFVVPIMFLFALGSSLSSLVKPDNERSENRINKKYDRAALVCFSLAIMFFGFPWISACLVFGGIFFWHKSKRKGGVSGKAEN